MTLKNYLGVTHHMPLWALPLWKKLFCKSGWHLFDEVATLDSNELVCDSCGLSLDIKLNNKESIFHGDAYSIGQEAYNRGDDLNSNPFVQKDRFDEWRHGWMDAYVEDK